MFHLRDTHFNARGNEVAGQALARFVRTLLDNPPTPRNIPSFPYALTFADSASRPFLAGGWGEPETAGNGRRLVWSTASSSELTLVIPDQGDVDLVFEARPFEYPGSPRQQVTVVVNGQRIERIGLGSGFRTHRVTVPADALEPTVDRVEFLYRYARAPRDVLPGNTDLRELGVSWESLAVVPSQP
jgi:hypothetical protein